MIAATGLLGGHPHFLHWGVIQISLANLIVIGLMVALFVLALVVPFPGSRPLHLAGRPGRHTGDGEVDDVQD